MFMKQLSQPNAFVNVKIVMSEPVGMQATTYIISFHVHFSFLSIIITFRFIEMLIGQKLQKFLFGILL